jgi:7-keto-8-aminopelargonate synthetase-like enzyme
VRELARRFREGLRECGKVVAPGDSPIIPVMLGDEELAMQAAEELRAQGMLIWPIRPPTVPRGGSRLRVTLSSDHTDEDVGRLMGAIGRLGS